MYEEIMKIMDQNIASGKLTSEQLREESREERAKKIWNNAHINFYLTHVTARLHFDTDLTAAKEA